MLGESMRRRRKPSPSSPAPAPRRGSGGGGRPVSWGRWLATVLGAGLACFGLGYLLSVFVLFPAPEPAAQGLVTVPKLVGRDLAGATRVLEGLGLRVEETRELAHPTEPAGFILGQSPLAGQQLRDGGTVRLAVSAGRARVPVPDLAGLPAADAAALAERLGFVVERREEPSSGPADVVLQVEPAPGTTRDLPATLTLIVSAALPPLEFPLDPAGGAAPLGGW